MNAQLPGAHFDQHLRCRADNRTGKYKEKRIQR
jgi:hypothetical protein